MKKTTVRQQKVSVSQANVRKAGIRLVPNGLVSAEIEFVQKELGDTATQTDLDASVVAVRRLPWSTIVVPD